MGFFFKRGLRFIFFLLLFCLKENRGERPRKTVSALGASSVLAVYPLGWGGDGIDLVR